MIVYFFLVRNLRATGWNELRLSMIPDIECNFLVVIVYTILSNLLAIALDFETAAKVFGIEIFSNTRRSSK